METPSQQFCSSCRPSLPASDFVVNRQGKRLKTCHRHRNAASLVPVPVLPPLDNWPDFLRKIKLWSHDVRSREFFIRVFW